jgi:DNA polymerase III epsilon subunit-like protein
MSPLRILLLDTETNGLPLGRQIPASEWRSYPAILQLSWAIYTIDTGRQIGLPESKRDIGIALHPSIPWNADAAAVHGLTEFEGRRGTPAAEALGDFAAALAGVDVVIAHNLAFDKAVIRAAGYAEADRGGPATLRSLWPRSIGELCTMRATRDLVQIPSPYYGPESGRWKAPKLNELYAWLYGHTYDVSGGVMHNAKADTHCLAQCVAALLRRGLLVVDGRRLTPVTTSPHG